nr:Sir2 family NAD-dependent protein deacetylase [Salinispora pacifica]
MEGVLPHRAAQLLGEARRVVIFTGAGMSAESGVPTFRDDLTGLWARFDAQQLATAEAFRTDPDLVWGWYEWRRARVRRAEPNSGHLAITTIESRIPGSTVITQNVDDLHERAGTQAVIHLHGSLFTPRCGTAAAHPGDLPRPTRRGASRTARRPPHLAAPVRLLPGARPPGRGVVR